jgi:hypothetical protein
MFFKYPETRGFEPGLSAVATLSYRRVPRRAGHIDRKGKEER